MTTATTDLRTTRGAAVVPVQAGGHQQRPRVLLPVLDAAAAVTAALVADLGPLPAMVATTTWLVVLHLAARGSAGPLAAARGERPVLYTTVVVGALGWTTSALLGSAASSTALLLFTLTAATLTWLRRSMAPRRASGPLRVVLLGDPADLATMTTDLMRCPREQLVVVAEGTPEDAAELTHATRPDAAIVVPGPRLVGRPLQRLSWDLERLSLPMLLHVGLADVAPWRTTPLQVGRANLVQVRAVRRRGLPLAVKQAWERAAAAALLIVTLPALALIALGVRLDSPGPVLFRQVRVGRDGQPFTMLKFRTMCPDAEALLARLEQRSEGDGVLFKLREDPRVTRVGRVLRRYSLDELPQLVNVLRGDMALVGPRPALHRELPAHDTDPHRRLEVAPGITGLWQISGRSDLSREEAVRLDLDYVDNWSLRRDLAIVLRTTRAVLGARGAY